MGAGLVGVRTDKVGQSSDDAKKPVGYLLPFEIISVHLLVVLVGAAYLATGQAASRGQGTGLELSDERLGSSDEGTGLRMRDEGLRLEIGCLGAL